MLQVKQAGQKTTLAEQGTLHGALEEKEINNLEKITLNRKDYKTVIHIGRKKVQNAKAHSGLKLSSVV